MTNTFETGIYRPPMHHCSLLLRVTENCPWNKCGFCMLYHGQQFKTRKVEDILEDIDSMGRIKNNILTYPGSPAKRYAYCSDTAYAPEIIPNIKNVDLLYHEATFAETELERAKVTYHSTARQAAEIARDAEVKKLVIGHYSSRYNELGVLLKEASEVFHNTELANEGKIFEL